MKKTAATENPIEKYLAELDKDTIAFRVDLRDTVRGYCRECFSRNTIIRQYKNILLATPENDFQFVTPLTKKDDEDLFGHICTHCHTPLSNWSECVFCHCIFWDDAESHMCGPMDALMRRDPENDRLYDWTVQRFSADPVAWTRHPKKRT